MKRGLLTALVLLIILQLCACARPLRTDAPMNRFCFEHSGMHTGLMYTLAAENTGSGWQAEISLLCGEREYCLPMTDEEAAELISLVKTHQLNRWNGFDKVDRSALDGTDFTLQIGYEDGQKLYASGSNAFPEGYKAAHEEIRRFFGALLEKHGIENLL